MKAIASNPFVLDSSLILSWAFADEMTPFTGWILEQMSEGAEAVVPSLWPFEITNTLLIAEKRGRLTAAKSASFLEELQNFNIVIDNLPLGRVFDRVVEEARRFALTSYDAAYLELALRRGLPLATLDNALKKAAKSVGVPLAVM